MIEVMLGIQTELSADRVQELTAAALKIEDPGVSVEIDDWDEVR